MCLFRLQFEDIDVFVRQHFDQLQVDIDFYLCPATINDLGFILLDTTCFMMPKVAKPTDQVGRGRRLAGLLIFSAQIIEAAYFLE